MEGQAQAAPAPENTGGTFLTSPPPSPAAAPMDPAQAGAEAAIAAAKLDNQRPEWAPEKFWDADKRSLKHEDLGKAYMNLERLVGHEKIPVPKSDDDKDGWERWWKAAGRPDDPNGYEFKKPQLPDDMGYDDDTEKSFRTWAHVNGLSKKQAQALYDGYVKTQIEKHGAWSVAQKQAADKVRADLMREHGAQFEAFTRSATSAIDQYGDPEFRRYLDETGLGNDPRMIRVFGRIGSELAGETRLKGKPAAADNPADIDAAIAKFQTDNKDALFSKNHPDHDRVVKAYNGLFEKRYGTDPVMVRD